MAFIVCVVSANSSENSSSNFIRRKKINFIKFARIIDDKLRGMKWATFMSPLSLSLSRCRPMRIPKRVNKWYFRYIDNSGPFFSVCKTWQKDKRNGSMKSKKSNKTKLDTSLFCEEALSRPLIKPKQQISRSHQAPNNKWKSNILELSYVDWSVGKGVRTLEGIFNLSRIGFPRHENVTWAESVCRYEFYVLFKGKMRTIAASCDDWISTALIPMPLSLNSFAWKTFRKMFSSLQNARLLPSRTIFLPTEKARCSRFETQFLLTITRKQVSRRK